MSNSSEYVKRFRIKRRMQARALLGDKCAKCGWDYGPDLEFDHIDPSTKEFTISDNWARRWEVFEAEIRKCQLLCRPCHYEKTAVDLRKAMYARAEARRGTQEAQGDGLLNR